MIKKKKEMGKGKREKWRRDRRREEEARTKEKGKKGIQSTGKTYLNSSFQSIFYYFFYFDIIGNKILV